LTRIEPVDENNMPEASKPLMEQAKQATGGTVINYFAEMANSPSAFEAYLGLSGGLSKGKLPQELTEELSISVSDYNGCRY
jgi:alkylhydroperoxidase family enzyme